MWSMALLIDEINYMKRDAQIQFQHTLREGNQLADYIANLAFDLQSHARRLLNLDKLTVN